jgi:hypothetical protein
VPIAGFAYPSRDARDACIAAIDRDLLEESTFESMANECRNIGAPVLFICCRKQLQWWKLKSSGAVREDIIPAAKVQSFFKERKRDFSPESIYRAKNLSRVHSQYQLNFVDKGLIPVLEHEMGDRLADLIKNMLGALDDELGRPPKDIKLKRWMFQCAFWLLGAKILHDKKVERFIRLDLEDVSAVLERVNRHYGAKDGLVFRTKREQRALEAASKLVKQFSSLNTLTIESLAHVYETTLIDKETRKAWGIHATPSYLVDYIVWQLFDWIRDIPQEKRIVLEPTCGHSPFLTSALRLLREIYEGDGAELHKYLKNHLIGIEQSLFAREIARLSLTLADVPNSNGWKLKERDVYEGEVLSKLASKSTILLCNPPFEDFKEEKAKYTKKGIHLKYDNKTAEVLWRTLPYMPVGSVFGVVVPRGFLENKNTTSLRKLLVEEFELREICVLPDNVFEFGDHESVIILGKKQISKKRTKRIRFLRVREKTLKDFKESYFAATNTVLQERFFSSKSFTLYVPELDEVWQYCNDFPKLRTVADVGKGFDFRGKDLSEGTITYNKKMFKGATRGFRKIHEQLMTYDVPEIYYLNLSSEAIKSQRRGIRGEPQILLNYAPVGRGPWQLKAIFDDKGYPFTSSFLAVRPRIAEWTLEAFWAILNSPLANAYTYCHCTKRTIGTGKIQLLPIPNISKKALGNLSNLVQDYFALYASQSEILQPEVDSKEAKRRMLAIDAEVMRLYDLPPKLERQVLDLFNDYPRKGVDFKFDRYFPKGFESWIPLHEYLSEEYQRSTPSFVNEWVEKNRSPEVIKAMKAAVEAFED